MEDNKQWLENKYEMFQIACAEGDYVTVRAIIEDTAEQGFTGAAETMSNELLQMPVNQFSNQSDPTIWK